MAAICRDLGFLPLVWSLLLVLGTISSYIVAICKHDVETVLPSVSKTAAFEPEGSIFNQVLDTIAFLGFIIVFVRFLQVEMATTSVKESDNGLRLSFKGGISNFWHKIYDRRVYRWKFPLSKGRGKLRMQAKLTFL